MKKFFILLIVATVAIWSCKEKNESEPEYLDIQPLKVGYNWTFIDSTFNDNGEFEWTDTSQLVIIGSSENYYEGEYIEMYYWRWVNTSQYWLETCENHTNYSYGMGKSGKSFVVERTIEVLYPAKPDDTWQTQWFGLDENPRLYCYKGIAVNNECISTDESLETFAGDYTCMRSSYQYILDNNNYVTDQYNCPGIGYIGLIKYKNGKKVYTKHLLDFDLTEKEPDASYKESQSEINSHPLAKYGVPIDR